MNVINKIREKKNRYFFDKRCAEIRKSAPLDYKKDQSVTVVSMVGHATVDMYLVAIKSFMFNFADANIEIINDDTLTEEDRRILRQQIPGVHMSNALEVDTKSCPDYSSWKRLFRIIEITQSSYVIQLDSDTVSLGPLVEVYSKAQANEGFMIGEGHWSAPIDLYHLQCITRRWSPTGPQGYSEQVLNDLPFFEAPDRYLHGCAGFAGYPKGSLSHSLVETLSGQIEEKIGRDKWRRWGSEQAITNCLISKSNNASTLPWPKYRNYMFPPTSDPFEAATFIHFIGSNRFIDATYQSAVENILDYIGQA